MNESMEKGRGKMMKSTQQSSNSYKESTVRWTAPFSGQPIHKFRPADAIKKKTTFAMHLPC